VNKEQSGELVAYRVTIEPVIRCRSWKISSRLQAKKRNRNASGGGEANTIYAAGKPPIGGKSKLAGRPGPCRHGSGIESLTASRSQWSRASGMVGTICAGLSAAGKMDAGKCARCSALDC
jgi:hypothetical protein